jgi:hypothetical protein
MQDMSHQQEIEKIVSKFTAEIIARLGQSNSGTAAGPREGRPCWLDGAREEAKRGLTTGEVEIYARLISVFDQETSDAITLLIRRLDFHDVHRVRERVWEIDCALYPKLHGHGRTSPSV